jgi:hypothetical protein
VKSLVRVGIPMPIRFYLLQPELRVLLRPCGVLGATVPEAAIDEYGYP